MKNWTHPGIGGSHRYRAANSPMIPLQIPSYDLRRSSYHPPSFNQEIHGLGENKSEIFKIEAFSREKYQISL